MDVYITTSKSGRNRSAKIWLDTLEMFEQGNLTQKEINLAVSMLEINRDDIFNKIQAFANGEETKPQGYERSSKF